MSVLEEKDLSRKENILKVTLDILKEEGTKGVTIRKIARLAHVNVALINYHFGSKDNLINEALKIVITDLRASFTILDDSDLSPRDKLQAFLLNYLSIPLKYPDVFRQIFLGGSFSFQSQAEFFQFLKTSGFEKINYILQDITGETNPKELMTMMMQLIGSLVFPIIMFPEFKTIIGFGFGYSTEPDLEKHISTLIDNYFHKFKDK